MPKCCNDKKCKGKQSELLSQKEKISADSEIGAEIDARAGMENEDAMKAVYYMLEVLTLLAAQQTDSIVSIFFSAIYSNLFDVSVMNRHSESTSPCRRNSKRLEYRAIVENGYVEVA